MTACTAAGRPPPPSHAPLQPARVRAGVRLGLGLRTAAGWGYRGGAPPLPPAIPARLAAEHEVREAGQLVDHMRAERRRHLLAQGEG